MKKKKESGGWDKKRKRSLEGKTRKEEGVLMLEQEKNKESRGWARIEESQKIVTRKKEG
jgi:hypothetical protein